MATQAWRQAGWFIVTWVGMANATFAQALERFMFAEPHLGTIVELTLYAPNENAANDAARAAFARVKQLDAVFSDYKSDSETMRLCATAGTGQRVPVSRELFEVLQASLVYSGRTDGAFDVTVGPLVGLWRKARKDGRLPDPVQLAEAKKRVGWKFILLDESARTVELTRTGMRLDFGSIAKGYIAQQVSQLLAQQGLTRTLVTLSGDIVASDAPPESDGWKVAIAPLKGVAGAPSRLVRLKQQAISTSGDAFQFVEIDGVRYSHIVDPHSGLGLTRRSSVTVVANDGTTADAMATAVCLLGPDRGLPLVEQSQGLAAIIVQATTDGHTVFESKRMSEWEIK